MDTLSHSNLTAKQRECMGHVVAFHNVYGKSPTLSELQAAMKLRWPRSITQFLDALEENGYLERDRSAGSRNIRVLRQPEGLAQPVETESVPILGLIACGTPLLAVENIESTVRVSRRLARPPDRYFILRTRGDSMDRAGIYDDDLVLVRQAYTAQDGDIVVALLDGDATLKRIRFRQSSVMLLPDSSNPDHSMIIVEREFQIQGVFVCTV